MNKSFGKKELTLNICLLVIFLTVITYVTIKYVPLITQLINEPEKFRSLLLSFGPASILVFIAFQVLQVIIAAIPGEVIQIAGGYVYGIVPGTLYSMIGILIGSMLAFYIARLLGFALVQKLVPSKDLEKFYFLINSPKAEFAMFILFIIPGIPKDILVYIAGLTPLKALNFFIITMIARFPGILGSAYIGANLENKHYYGVIIVSIVAVVLFLTGFFLKDKLIEQMKRKL
ncbi:MAG TPA: TVP38/TMEM64 family protein [Syntrophomonas sp.]|nr:TVP38/TMEM64 family protein [Syntrophomonas sp.]